MNTTQTVRSIAYRGLAVWEGAGRLGALRPGTRRPVLQARPYRLLQAFALITVGLTLLPLAYLVIRALGAGSEGLEYLLSERTLGVIGNSLTLTGAVALSASVIGVLFAWLTTRTGLPLARLWLVAGLLPLVIPSYIGAIALIAVLGPRGALQGLLEPLGVTHLPPLYGFFGAWLALTLFTYPYVALLVRTALLNLDPAQEESARSLGLNRWRVFARVTLPQLRPAIAAGMLLAALYTLSDFGAVALMRYNVFTRAIFVQYGNSFDRERAAVLALALVVLVVALLMLERRVAKTDRNYRAGGGGVARPARPLRLGVWRVPALLFVSALVLIGVVVPVGVLVAWLVQGMSVGAQPLTADLALPTANAVGVSGLAALAAGLLAIPLAVLWVRSASRFNRWLVKLAYLGNGLPGLVIGLALVFFGAQVLPAVYQTVLLLVFGYVVRFLPLGIGATRSALTQVSPRYEEAGRSLGLRSWQVSWRITLPLIRAGVLGGMALVFLSVMKELPATLMLRPTGFDTLATHIWAAHDAVRLSAIGAPALILLGVSALSLALILRGEKHEARA